MLILVASKMGFALSCNPKITTTSNQNNKLFINYYSPY